MLEPSENQDSLLSPLRNCNNYLLNRFLPLFVGYHFPCSRFFFAAISCAVSFLHCFFASASDSDPSEEDNSSRKPF